MGRPPGHRQSVPPLAIVSDLGEKDERFVGSYQEGSRCLLDIAESPNTEGANKLTSLERGFNMVIGSVRAEACVLKGPRLEAYPKFLARHHK